VSRAAWLQRAPSRARGAQKGVLIEPGNVFFSNSEKHINYFRVSFSSISEEKIEPGIKLLAETAECLLGHKISA